MKITKFKIVIALIVLLIGVRLMLPYGLLHYVKQNINQLPEYHVNIDSLSMSILQGSYTLHNLALYKTQSKIPVPFFEAKAINFSIQWMKILKGSLVAKIIMNNANIHFVMDPSGNDEQLTIDKQWQTIVKSLYPLNINALFLKDSAVTLQSFKGKPPFKLIIKKINGQLSNMQNVNERANLLSSNFDFTGESTGGGSLNLKGQFSPFSKEPTFKLEGFIKHIQIKDANQFLQHFTNIDVKDGNLSLFIETAAAKGKITGYAKPIIKDLKIINPEKPMGPIEALYKGALEIVSKILTNSKTDTIATQVNISGKIDDPETSTLSIIGYVLRHAFINALLPTVDHSIKMQDLIYSKSNKN